ncbi:MAG: hypothetical protein ACE3L7_31230 [Candidatus Pristimantibacillus sp.]
MFDDENAINERKKYYVSVQAGQVLEDPTVAAYELVITANEEEVSKLQTLLAELSSMDEAQMFHFTATSIQIAKDSEVNAGYDDLIQQIYRLLHECGTDETKKFIDTMNLW